jgi:hypothetical protein
MFAAEGRVMPEDRLQKAELTPYDLRLALGEPAKLRDVMSRLERAGDWMRKEYILLCDNTGDTLFYHRDMWSAYDRFVENMKAHGERLEVADFIRQVGNAKNPLSRAAEGDALDKVFNPAHWVDRLPEMLDLWSFVLPGWKGGSMTPKAFDLAYATAESLTYAKRVDLDAIRSRSALLEPLNDPAPDSPPVLALGLKALWDAWPAVKNRLEQRGEKITIADLRRTSGHVGDSCLFRAVKFGHFADVASISRSSEPLRPDDYLAKDRNGSTLLSILAERRELDKVFAPDLWAGRVGEMKKLWKHVPVRDREQVDIRKVEVAAKQATLRSQAKRNFKL